MYCRIHNLPHKGRKAKRACNKCLEMNIYNAEAYMEYCHADRTIKTKQEWNSFMKEFLKKRREAE